MRVIADPINNTVNLITAICYNNGLPKNIIWECFIFPHIWGGDAISRRSPDTVNLINSSSVVRIVFRIPFFLLLSFFFFPPPRLKARFAAEKTDTPSIPKAAGSKRRRDTNRGQRSTIWCRVAFFHTFSTSCFPHIKTLKRRRRRREKPILSQVSRREKKKKKKLPQVEIKHMKWIPDKSLSSGLRRQLREVSEGISANHNFPSNDTRRPKRQRNKQILRDVSFIIGTFSNSCQQTPQNSVISQRAETPLPG